jgi:hypothetical protein
VTTNTALTLIATLATLGTVFLAWRTVVETRASRREAIRAHLEELAAQTQLLEATTRAHTEEAAGRSHALEQERELQRQELLGRMADLLLEISRVALAEHLDPDSVPVLPPNQIRWSPIPGMFARLELEIAVYNSLDGDPLEKLAAFASEAKGHGSNRARIASESLMSISRLEARAKGIAIIEPS